jgi:hypothetical protein
MAGQVRERTFPCAWRTRTWSSSCPLPRVTPPLDRHMATVGFPCAACVPFALPSKAPSAADNGIGHRRRASGRAPHATRQAPQCPRCVAHAWAVARAVSATVQVTDSAVSSCNLALTAKPTRPSTQRAHVVRLSLAKLRRREAALAPRDDSFQPQVLSCHARTSCSPSSSRSRSRRSTSTWRTSSTSERSMPSQLFGSSE